MAQCLSPFFCCLDCESKSSFQSFLPNELIERAWGRLFPSGRIGQF